MNDWTNIPITNSCGASFVSIFKYSFFDVLNYHTVQYYILYNVTHNDSLHNIVYIQPHEF